EYYCWLYYSGTYIF
nr:immunoglobulin light chain junction region [Macaca mulatta]MOX83540.1 immunoglobulin light chain junction region [Macaca mulatta]MOX84075.1 immunoglobulin light chain junction region [Macaca mulatta]